MPNAEYCVLMKPCLIVALHNVPCASLAQALHKPCTAQAQHLGPGARAPALRKPCTALLEQGGWCLTHALHSTRLIGQGSSRI